MYTYTYHYKTYAQHIHYMVVYVTHSPRRGNFDPKVPVNQQFTFRTVFVVPSLYVRLVFISFFNIRIFFIYNTGTKTECKLERGEKRTYLFHALWWLTRSLSLDSLAYISVQATTGSLLQRAEQQRSFVDHAFISSYRYYFRGMVTYLKHTCTCFSQIRKRA